MEDGPTAKIIIEGITLEGRTFRPSDWAERISGRLATFHNHRMLYSPLLRPAVRNGYKCVIMDPALKQENPELFAHMLEFARVNNLRVVRENDETNDQKT
jgi:hypothetical protein